MAFSYTEIFKAASPLRGGTPVNAMAGGMWGTDAALADGAGLVSTTLTSAKLVIVNSVTSPAASGGIVRSTSNNGMVCFGAGLACSGAWLAFGI